MKYYVCFFLFLGYFQKSYAQTPNKVPEISGFNVALDLKKNQLIVNYNLHDSEDSHIKVSLKISDANGIMLIPATDLVGDIGSQVTRGDRKKIVWSFKGKPQWTEPLQVTLIADDLMKPDLAAIINQVDTTRMKADLKWIYGERNTKSGGAIRHMGEVRANITASFASNEINHTKQTVNVSKSDLYKYWADNGIYFDSLNWTPSPSVHVENVIGSKSGTDDELSTIVLSAHYDSFVGSPGLDDNGSGVIGLLEAMRILSRYNFSKSIKFVAFDLEEDGLVGSLVYVFQGGINKNEKISGVFNFDMIGVCSSEVNSQEIPEGFDALFPELCTRVRENDNRGDFVITITNETSTAINDVFKRNATAYVSDLKVESLLALDNGREVPPLAASDHASFWYAGIPAIHIGEGGGTRNSSMHSEHDSKDHVNLNYKFMSDIVKATIASVIEVAGFQHSTVVSQTINKK